MAVLHPLTGRPLSPLGMFKGRPIWPILGAEDGGDGTGSDGANSDGADGADGSTGDGGQSETDGVDKLRETLRKEREARREADKKAKAGAAAQAELDRIRAENQTEQEKAVSKARDEALSEARAEMLRERAVDKIEVALAGMNPVSLRAATLILAEDADSFVSDGKVDANAIRKAAEQLKADEPDLFRAAGSAQRAAGSYDNGARGSNDKPSGKEVGLAEARRRFPQHFQNQNAN